MDTDSQLEVTQIDKQGVWVLIGEKESFLSFETFPWFRNAPVSAIQNVELLSALETVNTLDHFKRPRK